MNEEIRELCECCNERLSRSTAQPAPNHCARIIVKPWISPGGFVNRQVHPPARLEDAAVFKESGSRIFRVMDHAVGDYDIGAPLRKGKLQIVSHNARTMIPLGGKSQRDAASVETDTRNSSSRQETEHATRSATDV